MKIKRKRLIKALNMVSPTLVSPTVVLVEEVANFIFTRRHILTYNGSACIRYPFRTSFSCTVPTKLSKVLAKVTDDDLDIELTDGDKLKIKGRGVKATLNITHNEALVNEINSIQIDNNEWKPLPNDFLKGLSLCLFATSKDITHKGLSNIFVNNDELIGSDMYRLSKYKMQETFNDTFLIPIEPLGRKFIGDKSSNEKNLLDLFEPTHYQRTNGWLHFKGVKNSIFSMREMGVEFPNINREFDEEGEITILPTNGLLESIERAGIFTDQKYDFDKTIEVQIEENKIKCIGQNEQGKIESETPLEQAGVSAHFYIHPSFFKQILLRTPKMIFQQDILQFQDENFQHFLALRNDEN